MRSHAFLFAATLLAFGAVACGSGTSSDSTDTEQGALATGESPDVECTTSWPVNGAPLVVSLTSQGAAFHLEIDGGTEADPELVLQSDAVKFDGSTRTFSAAANDSAMNVFSLTLDATHDRAKTFDATMSLLPSGEQRIHFAGKVSCRYLHP